MTTFDNGRIVDSYDPDIAGEIDARNGWTEPKEFKPLTIEEALASRAEALRWFTVECWLPDNSTGERRSAKEAACRFVALTVLLSPKLFEKGTTYQRLAKELEVSRAELSKIALKFSDKADLQFRGQRNKATREKNAKARIHKHKADRSERHRTIRSFIERFNRAASGAGA